MVFSLFSVELVLYILNQIVTRSDYCKEPVLMHINELIFILIEESPLKFNRKGAKYSGPTIMDKTNFKNAGPRREINRKKLY